MAQWPNGSMAQCACLCERLSLLCLAGLAACCRWVRRLSTAAPGRFGGPQAILKHACSRVYLDSAPRPSLCARPPLLPPPPPPFTAAIAATPPFPRRAAPRHWCLLSSSRQTSQRRSKHSSTPPANLHYPARPRPPRCEAPPPYSPAPCNPLRQPQQSAPLSSARVYL